jgi:alpha-L-fucosidase
MWAPNPRLNSAPGLLNRYKKAQTAGKAFILNVGPDTTGQISSEQQAVLMDLKKLIANEAANSAPAP